MNGGGGALAGHHQSHLWGWTGEIHPVTPLAARGGGVVMCGRALKVSLEGEKKEIIPVCKWVSDMVFSSSSLAFLICYQIKAIVVYSARSWSTHPAQWLWAIWFFFFHCTYVASDQTPLKVVRYTFTCVNPLVFLLKSTTLMNFSRNLL